MKTISRDKLIQEFRLEKVTSSGKKNRLPRMYTDEKVWMQITDPDFYKSIQPAYLHGIADDIDNYWLMIKRDCPKLNKNVDMKAKAEQLLEMYEMEFMKYYNKMNVTRNVYTQKTYYELLDVLKSIGINVESEKDDSTPNQTQNKSKK